MNKPYPGQFRNGVAGRYLIKSVGIDTVTVVSEACKTWTFGLEEFNQNFKDWKESSFETISAVEKGLKKNGLVLNEIDPFLRHDALVSHIHRKYLDQVQLEELRRIDDLRAMRRQLVIISRKLKHWPTIDVDPPPVIHPVSDKDIRLAMSLGKRFVPFYVPLTWVLSIAASIYPVYLGWSIPVFGFYTGLASIIVFPPVFRGLFAMGLKKVPPFLYVFRTVHRCQAHLKIASDYLSDFRSLSYSMDNPWRALIIKYKQDLIQYLVLRSWGIPCRLENNYWAGYQKYRKFGDWRDDLKDLSPYDFVPASYDLLFKTLKNADL